MPTEEELKNIISEMRSQGFSDEEIRTTLLDLGVPEETVNKLLGPPPKQEQAPQAPQALPEPEPAPEIQTLAVEEEKERLDELSKKVNGLHEKLESVDISEDLAELKEMLRELKRDVGEIKAMFSAIQKIMKEILETDRSILLDLYERSKR